MWEEAGDPGEKSENMQTLHREVPLRLQSGPSCCEARAHHRAAILKSERLSTFIKGVTEIVDWEFSIKEEPK